jgi:hypothetical protein
MAQWAHASKGWHWSKISIVELVPDDSGSIKQIPKSPRNLDLFGSPKMLEYIEMAEAAEPKD